VPHHVLTYENGDELLAVVYRNGQTHKLGNNGGTAGPSLYHPVIPAFLGSQYLLHQFIINERAFFQ
jgi:hypothetical protein